MATADISATRESLLATILSDESFRPSEPRSLDETGINPSLVESLVCKYLAVTGTSSGRGIADHICLPFGTLEALFQTLRTRQIIVHTGSAPFNDYYYTLTEQGRERAQAAMQRLRLRRPGARAADGLHALGRGPDDPGRSPPPRPTGKGLRRHLDRSRPVREPGPGRQLRRRPVPLRRAGQRQVDARHGGSRCASASRSGFRSTLIEDGQLIKLYDAAYHDAGGKPRGEHRQGRGLRPALGARSAGRPWSSAAS